MHMHVCLLDKVTKETSQLLESGNIAVIVSRASEPESALSFVIIFCC